MMEWFMWYCIIGPFVSFPLIFKFYRSEYNVTIGDLGWMTFSSILPFFNIVVIMFLYPKDIISIVLFEKAK